MGLCAVGAMKFRESTSAMDFSQSATSELAIGLVQFFCLYSSNDRAYVRVLNQRFGARTLNRSKSMSKIIFNNFSATGIQVSLLSVWYQNEASQNKIVLLIKQLFY